VLDVKADDFRYRLSGYLWGEDNANWLVSFAGSGGIVGKEPIYINGKAEWLYDSKISDHATMNFYNVVKFGDHSTWGWIVGSEIIVGGGIGGGGAVAGLTIGTGGVGTAAAVLIGARAALAGAGAAVSLSNASKTFWEKLTPPPEPPPSLPIPQKEEKFEPAKDKIVVAISKEGRVMGIGADGTLVLSGSVSGDVGTGALLAR
jgi:hypothetical protein